MARTAESLPLRTTVAPTDQAELANVVRGCCETNESVYPIGGGTSLDYGLPAKQPGVGLALTGLNRVIDYPSRDLTVTVEAGITLGTLDAVLAAENQELALDVPQVDRATVGGIVATNWNGPRRYALGAVRDQVIGISAVDGQGNAFKGGGRVVKNVAGYDFCKLLTGSLGTLGIITQLTFKLRPRSETSVLAAVRVATLDEADRVLAALVNSETYPLAIEMVGGPAWEADPLVGTLLAAPTDLAILVGLAGTRAEVESMGRTLSGEIRGLGGDEPRVFQLDDAARLWRTLADFSAEGDGPLTIKASLVPSAVTRFVAAVRALDALVSIQSHAGNGVVIARLSQFPTDGLSRSLVGELHPVAVAAQGRVTILSNPSGAEATRQSWWGGSDASYDMMASVKRQFDPRNLLNSGRFVFP